LEDSKSRASSNNKGMCLSMVNIEKFNLLNEQIDNESKNNEEVKSHTTTDLDIMSPQVSVYEFEYNLIPTVSFLLINRL